MINPDSIAEINAIPIIDILRLNSSNVISRKNKYICPNHNDSEPSLHVYEDTNTSYCFVCNKKYDVISLYMDIFGVEFIEAVNQLSNYFNIELKTDGVKNMDLNDKKDAFNLVQSIFKSNINKEHIRPKVINYILSRNFPNVDTEQAAIELIEKYKLGVSTPQDNISREILSITGLLSKNNYYLFGDCSRLIFPHFNKQGEIHAFAGRAFKDVKPKYINSVYPKSASKPYGFDACQDYILKSKTKGDIADISNFIIVVEGYTDVIALNCAGMDNVVPLCSTNLSPETYRYLKGHKMLIALDGDEAGINGMKRMAASLIPNITDSDLGLCDDSDMKIWFTRIPDGMDVAEFLSKKSLKDLIQAFRQNAVNYIDFIINEIPHINNISKLIKLTDKLNPDASKFKLILKRHVASALNVKRYGYTVNDLDAVLELIKDLIPKELLKDLMIENREVVGDDSTQSESDAAFIGIIKSIYTDCINDILNNR
jgi:DNA primase catalytic core